MSTEVLLLIASLAIIFYVWQRRAFNFWQRLGVKHIPPSPIIGNLNSLLTGRASFLEQISLLHNTKGFENEPVVGIYLFNRPGLLVKDLDLVKTIMIKKFNYFVNRAMKTDHHHDVLGTNNIFFLHGQPWRDLRYKLSPFFTSGKMKQMYPLMVEIGKDLEKYLDKLPKGSMLKIKDVCGRFTTDLIATTAFGLKANALGSAKNEFYENNKAIFQVSLRRGIDFAIIFALPMLVSLARTKLFPKQTADFVRRIIKYALDEREKSGQRRNDLIDILLAMKHEAKSDKPLDFDYLVAQAALFQTAGYETSASTMTMALFELVHHPEMQERLRTEIREYFGDKQSIDFDGIHQMPYLNQVVNETLRKYPIVGYAERECVQPATGEKFNLAPYYDLELPHGTPVYVATLAIHRDPQYWPDPEKFDPDRFAAENRDNLNMDAYMPFGIGPRNCVGMRLGLLQAKLGLVHLLRHHRVIKDEKTTSLADFKLCNFSAVIAPKDEICLQLQRT
ncbi:probable cytochrome P450 6w1 [Drosophila grimshawi]|uniref:GH20935 n=1 Tax=Drosophila grimshawi TaxID=7222 RepID=B4J493_DROGR|nr:probable cytochrome P450 6w1 [Drosophila grimshawi]EDW00573.1 GH20935 [Drosophila grimshawi]